MYSENAEKWKKAWSDKALFLFSPKDEKKPIFAIDTPPPNTTGGLHMGHVFWVCYIDALAKYNSMKGFNMLYPVGWDEHGFPTELEVEKKYGRNLSREDFYNKCVEVSSQNRQDMKEWMLKLGATFDEKLEYRTTDKDYVKKVQLSLLMMYEKGLLYRGDHPIEWCTRCGSGISREQAEEKEMETNLNHVEFGTSAKKTITIATTRPELLHACVALAVNPTDKRYKSLIGKTATVPIFNKEVKIIGDEEVDKDFGTGAEMVCTFGDKRDIALYYKHKLDLIEAMDGSGRVINSKQYDGMKLQEARDAVLKDLEKAGALKKQETLKHTVKVHDRCLTPIELISTTQWFVKTKESAETIKNTARSVKWVPESTRQRLEDWANFIEWDWAITRNRVFGTPMPFWYCEKCNYIVPPKKEDLPLDSNTKKPYVSKCPKCSGKIVGTKETLDGWVDTSITSMVIAGWPDNKKLFSRAFPSMMRIQGTDIVRTWAFYTIFRTRILASNKPWERILVHGMVLGTDGREMHKSWGNGIMPEVLMQKYPIDAIRLWVAMSGGIGKDKPFSYAEMDYSKSFINKLYNTANFVKLATEEGKGGKAPKDEPHKSLNVFDLWILHKLNEVVGEVTTAYDGYLLHEAMNRAIDFYWHDFADYYIENVKHRVYSKEKSSAATKAAAIFTLNQVLNTMLRIFAPVIPFVSEEVNAMFDNKSLFEQEFPKYKERPGKQDYVINGLVFKSSIIDFDYENAAVVLNDVISEVRKQKAAARIALNKEITSININVPDEYYKVVSTEKGELGQICKAKSVKVEKGKEFSVSIQV